MSKRNRNEPVPEAYFTDSVGNDKPVFHQSANEAPYAKCRRRSCSRTDPGHKLAKGRPRHPLAEGSCRATGLFVFGFAPGANVINPPPPSAPPLLPDDSPPEHALEIFPKDSNFDKAVIEAVFAALTEAKCDTRPASSAPEEKGSANPTPRPPEKDKPRRRRRRVGRSRAPTAAELRRKEAERRAIYEARCTVYFNLPPVAKSMMIGTQIHSEKSTSEYLSGDLCFENVELHQFWRLTQSSSVSHREHSEFPERRIPSRSVLRDPRFYDHLGNNLGSTLRRAEKHKNQWLTEREHRVQAHRHLAGQPMDGSELNCKDYLSAGIDPDDYERHHTPESLRRIIHYQMVGVSSDDAHVSRAKIRQFLTEEPHPVPWHRKLVLAAQEYSLLADVLYVVNPDHLPQILWGSAAIILNASTCAPRFVKQALIRVQGR